MILPNYSPNLSLCGGTPPAAAPTPPAANPNPPVELHACMGLNACKGHDRFGTNNCAGTGYCATAAAHTCHTLNNCRGQGGCGLYGSADEQMKPGANDCAWQGSCAVPIQAERFSTMGENAGKSTWKLARALFEQRMQQANRVIGDPPSPCGPSQSWLTAMAPNNQYDSCGNSGNKYCSFGFNAPADNAKKLCEGQDISVPLIGE